MTATAEPATTPMTYEAAVKYFDNDMDEDWDVNARNEARTEIFKLLDMFPDAVTAVLASVRARMIDGTSYGDSDADTGCLKCTIARYQAGSKMNSGQTFDYMTAKGVTCSGNLPEEDWFGLMRPAINVCGEKTDPSEESEAAYVITERWLLDWMRERGKA